MTVSARRRSTAVLVVVVLVALLGPSIAVPVSRGALTGLFAPSLGLAVAFALVGAFLVLRGATTVIAVLVSLIGLLSAAATLASVLLAVARADGSTGAADLAQWVANLVSVPALTLLAPLGLLLPDGRLTGRRWRLLVGIDASVAVGFIVLAVAAPGTDFISTDPAVLFDDLPHPLPVLVAGALFLALLMTIVALIGALVARRRRADGIERAQLTCLLYGGALNAVLLAATIPAPDGGWGFVAKFCSLVPVAIGVAVLRFRLYEIDRIVSRTVAYAVVIVVLAGVYVGVLAGLTALLPADVGQVGVAAATLAVTALAIPLTRRVRAAVDGRFDRSRFDAAQVATRFAARVRARPDADDITGDLLDVVDRTVSPRSASIWLVPR